MVIIVDDKIPYSVLNKLYAQDGLKLRPDPNCLGAYRLYQSTDEPPKDFPNPKSDEGH